MMALERSGAGRMRRQKMFSLTLLASAAALFGLQAQAQDAATAAQAPAEAGAAAPSVTEELIRMLAEHNAIKKEDAEKLIERLRVEQGGASAPATAATPDPKGRVRVYYLPESQKQKMREELKQEVMETAKAENWAAPNRFPEWVNRIKLEGDVRMREEFDLMDSSNDPFLINYQELNSGAPYNFGKTTVDQPLPPLMNTTEDRNLMRLRARLGLAAQVTDDLSVNLRLATGNTVNPVSTNQTLGNNFNRLTFQLERAYMTYKPVEGLSLYAGRMPSIFRTSELVWDEDLNFDGFGATYQEKSGVVRPFVSVGAYSVQNTAFDFPSTRSVKSSSRDRWLFALQVGEDAKITDDVSLSAAAAYYHFTNMRGEPSSLCDAPTAEFACNTDDSRPAFMQYGNTLYALRNLQIQNADDPQFQYFGLASRFRIASVTSRLDWTMPNAMHLLFDLEYAYNFGYDKSEVLRLGPVNNYGQGDDSPYDGGNKAWLTQLQIGHLDVAERGKWHLRGGYRRLESDALVDAYTDSDFHLGGTNAKGFFMAGAIGFTHNAWFSAQYFGATEVSGSPFAVDVLQFDVHARF